MKVRSTIEILRSLCHFHLFVCASATNFAAKLTRRHSLTPQLICEHEIWKSAGAERPKTPAWQHLFRIIMGTERPADANQDTDAAMRMSPELSIDWNAAFKTASKNTGRWGLSSLKVCPKNRAWDVETRAIVQRHHKPKRLLLNKNAVGQGEAEHCQTRRSGLWCGDLVPSDSRRIKEGE